MQRNRKTEKEKYLKKLSRRYWSAYREANELEWVPVEEPQFLGWEVRAVLNESALRRGDLPNLLKVMEYFKMNRTVFTRKQWVVSVIKSSDYRYENALKEVAKMCRKRHTSRYYWDIWETINNNYMPFYGNTRVNQATFDTVPEYLHKYFTKYTEAATVWRPEYNYYKLSSVFPLYQLRLKVDRAFSTHKGIPNGEAESEYQHIRKTLEIEHYWGSSGRYESYNHKRCNRVTRKAWNMASKQIAKQVNEDHIYEVIEHQEYLTIGRVARD